MRNIDWTNTIFLISAPIIGIFGTYFHFVWEGLNTNLLIFSIVFYILSGLSITAGYHRLFSHRSYEAHWTVRLFFLIFGAAAAQNSALKWSRDHRIHHQFTDTDKDPYSVKEGFFHAHMGWIFKKDTRDNKFPKDLTQDSLVMWQHKYYMAILVWVSFLLPTLVGFYYGAPIGGLVMGGFLRITLVHHATFFINSLCHILGGKPYDANSSARDNALTAIFTFGEGYHNFHHRFQTDYRNGLKLYHFDPSKWLIGFLSFFGLASKLKRVAPEDILRAKLESLSVRSNTKSAFAKLLDESKLKIEEKLKDVKRAKDSIVEKKVLLREIELDIRRFRKLRKVVLA